MFVADSGWSTLIDAASEAELISRSRQGDHTAFVSALQLHDPHLRRLTSNAIGDPQEVDRLLLAVYIEARSTLLAGEAEGPFGTWLIRLVFEACDDAKSSSKSSMATHSSSNLSQTRSPGHASLVEMTLEETFAITLVAGERLALTHVVSLLDTNVNGLTVMLRNARQALTSKGSEAADQIVADLAVPRHDAGFWNELNLALAGPVKNPIDKRIAKRVAAAEAAGIPLEEIETVGFSYHTPRIAVLAAGAVLLLLALTISMLTQTQRTEPDGEPNTLPPAAQVWY